MFNYVGNNIWRAEGFGCMWVQFEFRPFNNLCLLLSFESKKTSSSDPKKDFMVQRTFSFENLWIMQFSTIPLRSCCSGDKFGTLVWNYAWKKAPTFSCSIKGFEIFWWCWTSFIFCSCSCFCFWSLRKEKKIITET